MVKGKEPYTKVFFSIKLETRCAEARTLHCKGIAGAEMKWGVMYKELKKGRLKVFASAESKPGFYHLCDFN